MPQPLRYAFTAAWISLSNLALAWWVKGDNEMAWIFAFMMLPVCAAVIGTVSYIVLRRGKPTAIATAASVALSVGLLLAAVQTPNRLSLPPNPGAVYAASRFVGDRALVEQRMAEWSGTGVALAGVNMRTRDGFNVKRGFSFTLDRYPGDVSVTVEFTAGPPTQELGLAEKNGAYQLAMPAKPAPDLLYVRREAWQTLIPDGHALFVAGQGEYPRDTLVPILVANGETAFRFELWRVFVPAGPAFRRERVITSLDLARDFAERPMLRHFSVPFELRVYFTPRMPREALYQGDGPFRIFMLTPTRRANLLVRFGPTGSLSIELESDYPLRGQVRSGD